ncbi:response regulator [Desulfosediminicola ganghwensis]|uniref:response regulator n=1 Tax=Desulfosediminicola ganghwensis TaxID=2569540 RepID=UPI0010ABA976|nr:response regulator [Desulfosediminicola ganghwensis]
MAQTPPTVLQDSAETLLCPNILVVDDEPRIREACSLILQTMGFEVQAAADGAEGLKLIEDHHFDILLLDLVMPNMSGFELLSRVRDIDPDTVVIVITGYATLEHSIEAMKKGAFDFIPKPFTPDQLKAVVTKSLRYTHALQDIATNKSRMRVMVNKLHDGVLITDMEKRVVLANPSFKKMIGARDGSLIGNKIGDKFPSKLLLETIESALSTPASESGEHEINTELIVNSGNGEPDKILSLHCSPYRGRSEQNLGTITLLHDITAAKQIEQMKSDFVSMVSHEIRSPINSVLMQLSVIMDGLAGEVTDKQQEILERASGKIKNLDKLVTDLLDLSRIESGLISYEYEDVDLTALLQDQVSFHSPRADAKKIAIELQLESTLPVITAVPRHMEEIFTNLLTNAIKYSPENTTITVQAKADDSQVYIQIKDSGYGIPAEDIDHIFDRFYRVKDQQTRTIHGTGLGLAIVKSIVDSLNGKISVESTYGRGTAFSIMLPCNDTYSK